MPQGIFFEDVGVGQEIGPLKKKPTTRQLIEWAGASDDYTELHYDKDVAAQAGFPAVVVHGRLKASFLGQLITDWMGEPGTLHKFSCSYRAVDFPGVELTCKGKVVRKEVKGLQHLVECELWTENEEGKITTLGTAVIELPSRGSAAEA